MPLVPKLNIVHNKPKTVAQLAQRSPINNYECLLDAVLELAASSAVGVSKAEFGVRRRARKYVESKRRQLSKNGQSEHVEVGSHVLPCAGFSNVAERVAPVYPFGGLNCMRRLRFQEVLRSDQPTILYAGPVYNNCRFAPVQAQGLSSFDGNGGDGEISFKKRRIIEEECVSHKD